MLFLPFSRNRLAAILLALIVAAPISISPTDAAAAAAGSSVVAGIVTGSDGAPAVGIKVSLRNDDGGGWLWPDAHTDESGVYRFENVAANRYTLSFSCHDACVGNYIPEYWDDIPNFDAKTWFDLGVGERVDLQTELELAGEISGVVRGDDGAPIKGVDVDITSVTDGVIPPQDFAVTDAEGRYRFRNLPEAGYTLRFAPEEAFAHEYFSEFWKDQTQADTADVIRVTAGEAVSGIDPGLTPTAWISGRVINEDGVPFGSFDNINVYLYRVTDDGASWVWTSGLGSYPNGWGEFRFDGLRAGTYTLSTQTLGWGGLYGVTEWWQDKPDLASADRIVVAPGDRFDATVVLEGGPVGLSGPKISGTAAVGETLTAIASSDTPSATLTYEWRIDEAPVANWNQPTFQIQPSQFDSIISVKVTASAPGRITVSRTAALGTPVAIGTLTAPTPTISGAAFVGSTLTANAGTWTSGTELTYQWKSSGIPIPDATNPTLVLSTAHLGNGISVRVTGSKPGFTTVKKDSAFSEAVALGVTKVSTPTISGRLAVGSTLIAGTTASPKGAAVSYTWWADGVAIAHGSTLQLEPSHLGKRMSVDARAFAENYRDGSVVTSPATAPVRPTPWAGRFPAGGGGSVLDVRGDLTFRVRSGRTGDCPRCERRKFSRRAFGHVQSGVVRRTSASLGTECRSEVDCRRAEAPRPEVHLDVRRTRRSQPQSRSAIVSAR